MNATMNTTPNLFDRQSLTQHRLRAKRHFGQEGEFLLKLVADDMLDRLSLVKRRFPVCVELAGHTGILAQKLSSREGTERIWRMEHHADFLADTSGGFVGFEEALPLKPDSIDLIVSPLSLHWVNDLPGALLQIRKSLKPDGLFLGALPGEGSLAELRNVLFQADSELSRGVSPRVPPFPRLKDMGGLLQRAGFALPVTDQESLTIRYDTMFALLQDLRRMGATNNLTDRSRIWTKREVFLRAAKIYAEQYSDPDGRIRATFQIINISGWAPHQNQQKPGKNEL